MILITLITSCNKSEIIEPAKSSDHSEEEIFSGVLEDNFNSKNIVLYANSKYSIIVAFDRELSNGSLFSFSNSSLDFPDVFMSQDSTIWNVFGEAISGPQKGENLTLLNSQMGYWFGFATFFPKVTLKGEAPQARILNEFLDPEWLVNPDKIIRGASKDGIPSIDAPQFIPITNLNKEEPHYLSSSDLVSVIMDENEIKVYPHKVLDWHEVVNDYINGKPITVSYCPLTGTSDVWERTINGNEITFGVSGFLYNNNLILYDRETNSLWPQILKLSVNGPRINTKPTRLQTTVMNWGAVKKLNDELFLLSDHTGFQRDYDFYPYGNYKSIDALLFPISFTDYRVPTKELVLNIVINDKSKSYRFKDFRL